MPLALSFVIPLYNSAATIASLVHEIEALTIEGGHEVILVDDGSADATSKVCRDLVRTARIPVTLVEHAQELRRAQRRPQRLAHCPRRLHRQPGRRRAESAGRGGEVVAARET